MIDRKHKGAFNELLAVTWLLKQGYEVFRNVSFHGDIDLLAVRGDDLLRLDVKGANYRLDGSMGQVALSKAQIEAGVKCLLVYPDGQCSIDLSPPVIGATSFRSCAHCQTDFRFTMQKQRHCSPKCRMEFYAAKNGKTPKTRRK